MAQTIQDQIRAIQDRIGDPTYWTKGMNNRYIFSQNRVQHCVNGAALSVAIPVRAQDTLIGFLQSVLNDYLCADNNRTKIITLWNDADKTTHADVMLFLDTCLDVAEAEGI